MNDMRHIVLVIISAAAVLSGCSGAGKNKVLEPEEVVKAFCNAVTGGEYELALEFCDSTMMCQYVEGIRATVSEAARRDSSAAGIAAAILKEAEIEIGDIRKEQDRRLVDYSIVISDEIRKDKIATMKKEEGEWKIEAITDRI